MYRRCQVAGVLVHIVLTVFLLSGSSPAQITFERTYGGSGYLYDVGYCVQQTSDGGYIITGVGDWDPFWPQMKQVYLVRTDSLGDTLWTRIYGTDGTSSDIGYCVRQTSDGGFVVTGRMESDDTGALLMKTDSQGDSLWTRIYGGGRGGYSVRQTSDDGYIIAGITSSFGEGTNKVYLIKTDSLGDTLWTKVYVADGWEGYARSVQEISGGGYIITGKLTERLMPNEVLLMKMDSLGNELWTRAYGIPPSGEGQGYSVQQTSDGGYVVAGTAGGGYAFILKTDAAGDTLWTRVYGGAGGGFSVRQTFDGGYVIAGAAVTHVYDSYEDVYVVRTNSVGDTLWTRVFGFPMHDRGNSVWQTSDSGYVVAGYRSDGGKTSLDVYLIKMNKDGFVIPRRDAGVLSIGSPPDTVFTDSIYSIEASIMNFGNIIDTFDVTATIDGSVGENEVVNLSPGCSITVHLLYWRVPLTDSATYTTTVRTNALGDIDSTNDCMQKAIFAYNPTGITDETRNSKIENRPVLQSMPNPFRKTTVIAYSLANPVHVTLCVYDITGSLLKTLVDEHKKPGVHQVHWNASDNPSGVYFITLQTANQTTTKKMILLR